MATNVKILFMFYKNVTAGMAPGTISAGLTSPAFLEALQTQRVDSDVTIFWTVDKCRIMVPY